MPSASRTGKPIHGTEIENIRVTIIEDSASTIKLLEKGRSVALRHVCRIHPISLECIRETLAWKEAQMHYVSTYLQLADMCHQTLLV